MIEVEANKSVRNVAEDALAGVRLLTDSVFFGVNGAGKSTVCEVLSQAATLRHSRLDAEGPLHVFAFDDKWRKDKVGDFVEGGTAEGVTTVKLNDGASGLEEKIREAQSEWEAVRSDVKAKTLLEKSAKDRQNAIVDDVAEGIRKTLEKECPSLSGQRFKRPAIRALLEEGDSTVLSQSEVEEKLVIAASQAPGFLPQLPSPPREWSFTDHLWQEVTAEPSASQTVVLIINDWVREGIEVHEAGDSCQFCTGTVTTERMEALKSAVRQAEEEASSLIKSELAECRSVSLTLRKFKDALEATDLSASIYGTDLQPKKAEALLEIGPVLDGLKASEDLLEERVKNPRLSIQGEKPEINFSKLQGKCSSLKESHSKATEKIAQHSQNQEMAVNQLKRHCCATDGSGWSSAAIALEEAERKTAAAIRAEKFAKDNLDDLKRQVSTTADTAEFLDNSLGLILGEKTLRVSEGSLGEGYRITRHDQRADGMSEGEKKLVSLLYFCAEFLAENRKQLLKNSVIIFDDLGSELDEPRLLAVDRFISNHFQNPKPAALLYFTHSHAYLKILQSRLGGRAVENKRNGQVVPPKAVFYEVYKDSFSGRKQSTLCRQWDDEAIKLTNDYWLSFYMVLRAFEDLQSGAVPTLGTGNFCRKVLEGFTEFRAPGDEQFGSRIDKILSEKGLSLSPALSKVVNGLSHSDLNKSGGVFSRNEVEHAVVQTLNLMRLVDEEHFLALLIKFRGKQDASSIENALQQRTGIKEAATRS